METDFVSGTGLHLGMTKVKASAVLGTHVVADLTDVRFEEIEKLGASKVLHSQVLSLEFKDDRLVRFSVYDFRESA